MKLNDTVAETLFGNRIDGRFPYSHPTLSTAIIEESRSISVNAVFYVLDEICRLPHLGITTTQERQRELVEEWAYGFEHPLKDQMLRCAEALISERPLTPVEAVAAIEEVGLFDGQRAALSVAYFSGDCTSKDGNAALEDADRRVRATWDRKGV